MAIALDDRPIYSYFPEGFPFSAVAWKRLRVSDLLPPDGLEQSDIPRFARQLAVRIHEIEGTLPENRPARAGELLAAGLLTDIFRYVVDTYAREHNRGVLARGLARARTESKVPQIDVPVPTFVGSFPPDGVRRGQDDGEAFLARADGEVSNEEVVVRELLLLHLSNINRALRHYKLLFDDRPLAQATPYPELLSTLEAFFEHEPPYPATDVPLLRLLRQPLEECPDSIEDQLNFVRTRWESFLPTSLLERIRITRGILKEETQMRGLGPGPIEVLRFGAGDDGGAHEYPEFEAFSQDTDWMPNVVLIAKSTYVWLDQLSKRFDRPVHRLDQIPDEALDELGRWGFTGLWLIGLWERSAASRDIKRRMGNPEAEASAYSLYDYTISADLGGEEAYENLRARAWRRGIRLASDMVPNHVGIFSKWVIEHPDWFIQSGHPPFPTYAFTGPNLSYDDRVELRIEDGYWNHSDAAVVFQRVDRWSGDVRYIYHGNDGTSMPWNDTAQLNFMNAEVREAVLQTILHVARMFPIIRFDAAMTLAKKHYQRLWFPKPGEEGAIPSRAEYGMDRASFDEVFPKEFWREVVDRVAQEAPETLLLAEAFWLMEGYFVRTLGMHRVYNSAFMNMLKLEENSKYRQTVKNVLEFSPEVLQRFVNFMNNPDEDTAEAQFGTGDKYFGVAVLLSTMPGLPMFGHGQVEGFTEKYGMEYRRAYKNESIDWDLVQRHEWEIFPLMRRRALFSGATHFALYDFVAGAGYVDENVFAYSNRREAERALIVFNNAYEATDGVVHTSTAINEGTTDTPHLVRRSLAEALALDLADNCYYIYRDQRTGLEYLEHAQRIADYGMHLRLDGYQYYAFVEWTAVYDMDHSWGRLHGILAGQGVPNVREAYIEMQLASILEPFRDFMKADHLAVLADPKAKKKDREPAAKAYVTYLDAVSEKIGAPVRKPTAVWRDAEKELITALSLPRQMSKAAWPEEITGYLKGGERVELGSLDEIHRVAALTVLMRHMGGILLTKKATEGMDTLRLNDVSSAWLHDWLLVKPMAAAIEELGASHENAWLQARLARICVSHARQILLMEQEVWGPLLDLLLGDADVRAFLHVHYFGGRHWMNREQLERLVYMLYRSLATALLPLGDDAVDPLLWCRDNMGTLLEAADDVGYDFDRFNEVLR